ncbi:zinc transporter-like protein [Rhynchospora pubera]|uniref:Zinc transporter-like protein n=1 Tax=Rhynchospora pubera TaxID=906938 RepID=A0AAV8BWP1_9POAL|nr:zinc transporter-like protein [Rhynchospora pubera]
MKPHSDPDHHHHHHHQHRRRHLHLNLSVPPRNPSLPPSFPTPTTTTTPTPSSLPTPSKRRHFSSRSSSSLSSLFLLLFSLRSLYSLLPFVRSAPSSFSLFPFSFLVTLLSFLFLIPLSPSLRPISRPHLLPLAFKSLLLSFVLLLRFHSLVYCRAGASILADLSGSLLARFVSTNSSIFKYKHLIGLISLTITLVFLSWSWDRVGCFPLSNNSLAAEGCVHLASMLMPFLSGFLGFFEQGTVNWAPLRQLGKRRVHVLSLGLTSAFLFIPALVSFLSSREGDLLSVSGLGWPLVNTVLFGVILSETYSSSEDKKLNSAKEYRKGILLTFLCTLVLELFYYPKLSLPGFLLCGFFLWISVLQLGPSPLNYAKLGNLDDSISLYSTIMGPIKHILSERKSRKIAAFLLINACYMVVEFVAGFMSNSLGLISDACHMLFDCAALAIGLYASYIARFPANSQFNYGRGRFEVLSGYVNAVFLVLVGALIVLESFERILDPMEISTGSLLAVSIGGLLVNVIGLVFFHEEHHHAHGGSSCSHGHQHHHHNHAHAHPHADDSHGGRADVVPNHNENHHECSIGHTHSHSHTHLHSCSSDQGVEKVCTGHHMHGSSDEHLHLHSHSHSHEHVNDHHEHDTLSCSKHKHDSIHDHSPGKHDGHVSKQHHRHVDHNMEGIFLHVLADTMGSVGVVISTLLIKYKGWLVADPICSVFISIMIISSVLPLLRNSAEILLQRVPRNHGKELKRALDDALHVKGVCGVHNMHVWSFTNTDIVGTFHLCVSEEKDKVSVLEHASEIFRDAGLKDLTIQIESVGRQS